MSQSIRISEKNNSDDWVEITVINSSTVTIETYSAWSGDTEGGFGSGATITLDRARAAELGRFLIAFSGGENVTGAAREILREIRDWEAGGHGMGTIEYEWDCEHGIGAYELAAGPKR